MNKLLYPANENGTYVIPVTFRDRNSIVSDARVEQVIISLQNREGDYVVNRAVAAVGVQSVSLSGNDLRIEDQTKDQELRIFTVDAVVDDRPVHMEWEMYIKRLLVSGESDIDPSTVALLHCDGTNGSFAVSDSALGGTAPHIFTTRGDAHLSTAQQKYGTGSLLLDRDADWLDAPNSSDFLFGSGDFCVEAWVRYISLDPGGEYDTVASVCDTSSDDFSWIFSHYHGVLLFEWTTNGWWTTATRWTTPWAPSLNTWYHLAVSRNGDDFRFFADGLQRGPTRSLTGAIGNSTTVLRIGAYVNLSSTVTGLVDGFIDEVRISKGNARYTANFTPSGPFTPYL